MKDHTIIDINNKPISLFYDFINNDNNDHLLCGIIEDLWTQQDLYIDNIFNNNNNNSSINSNIQNTYINNKNDLNEMENELQAYLYEIDMNLEYFRNDYKQFNDIDDIDDSIDKLLSFAFHQDACNMLLYENEISYKLRYSTTANNQLANIFAHVEDIPEFVPNFTNSNTNNNNNNNNQNDFLSEFDFDNENFLLNDDEFMNINEAQLLEEYLNDDIYGIGMSAGTGDIFENVYNYNEDEFTGISSSDDNSNGGSSGSSSSTNLNKKYLAAYYLRRKLAAQLDIDNSSSSSSASSLNTAGLGSAKFLIPRLIKSTKDMFRKPCVYMLNEGRCMRSDCRFAHDLHNITCKYWLEGECLKGDSCEFLHDFAPTSSTSSFSTNNNNNNLLCSNKNDPASILKQQKQKDFNLNNLDFPELSASATSSKSVAINVENQLQKQHAYMDNNNNNNCSSSNDIDINMISESHEITSKTIEEHANKLNSNNNNNNNKKSRKFKDNVLYSLSLPAFQITSRKKNIN